MRLTSPHRLLVLASAGLAALAMAPVASAGQVVLDPPGKAGANQYFETIPTSDGNAAPPSATSGTPPIDKHGPGSSALHQLQKLGAAGQAAASFATSSAPAGAGSQVRSGSRAGSAGSGGAAGTGGASTHTGSRSGTGPKKTQAVRGGSSFSGIFDVLGGSDAGGIGVLMPILLIGGLLVAILSAGLRRRRGGSPSTPSV